MVFVLVVVCLFLVGVFSYFCEWLRRWVCCVCVVCVVVKGVVWGFK